MSQNTNSLVVFGQSSRRPYKYDIPNSVRFRGQTGSNDGQYFTRSITSSSNVDTGTISFWIRHARYTAGDEISHQEICLWGRDEDQNGSIEHENVLFGHNIQSNGTSTGAAGESYTHYQRTDLRDITSWYHVVMQYTPNSATYHSIAKLYLNGVEQPTLQYNTGAVDRLLDSGSQDIFIGRPEDYFQGYLAEYHFVDGTAYQASDFGKFDPDGNWVPKRFEGTYGSTGFYLDFSDPDDLGADRSGNNQHFTPNGFVSTGPSVYTKFLEGSHSPPNYSYQPIENRTAKIINAHFAFNGEVSSGYSAYPVGIDTGVPTTANEYVSNNGFLYFRYTLTGVTKFRVRTAKPIAEVWFNGTITSFTDTSAYNGLEWVDLSSVLPGTTITEFAIKAGYGYGTYIAAIEINDQQLVDPAASLTDWTYDSPTNTHAIWSDLSQNSEYDWTRNAGLDLSYNNNLQTTFGGFTEGKYYMEIVPNNNRGVIGVTDAFQPDQNNLTTKFPTFQNDDSLGFDIQEQKVYRSWSTGIACSAINQGYLSGVTQPILLQSYWGSQGSSFGSNDILGVSMDFDNGELEYFYNGTSLGKLHKGYEDDVYGNDDITYNSSITDKIFTSSSTQGRFGFDGSNTTAAAAGTGGQNGNWIYFKPSNPIPIFSSLEIFTNVFAELRVNGNDTGFSDNSGTIAGYTISNPPSMLYEIAIKGNSLNRARFYQIKIDGVPLTSVPPLTPGKKYYITGYGRNLNSNVMQTNFGQQPYKYEPPAGFTPVSRKNMRRQKFIDGEDHFKTISVESNIVQTDTIINNVATAATVGLDTNQQYTWTPQDNSNLIGITLYMSGGSGGGGHSSNTTTDIYCYNGLDAPDTVFRSTFIDASELNGIGTFYPGAAGGSTAPGGISSFITGAGVTYSASAGAGGVGGNYLGRYTPSTWTYPTPPEEGNMENEDDHYPGLEGGAKAACRYTVGTNYGSAGVPGQIYIWEHYPTSAGIGTINISEVRLNGSAGMASLGVGRTGTRSPNTAYSGEIVGFTTTASGSYNNKIYFYDSSPDYNWASLGSYSQIIETTAGGSLQGTGALQAAQLHFPNGLWWVKDMNNVDDHYLVDCMNGTNDALKCPTGTRGHTYSNPDGKTVIWGWKVGDSDVDNSSGSIASTCRSNPDAGFSIVQWTGTASDETIGHGLNQSPEFIIISGGSSGIPLYHHKRMSTPSSLYLRLDSASTQSGGVFRDAEFTDSVFAVSGDNIVNQSGELMTAYLWHSVPGFSAIGSFEGNGSRQGPLIELGFRPAFVMFKTNPNNYNWRIHDSEREYTSGTDVISGVFNTQWNYLEANTTAAQSASYSRSYYYQHASIDFLSNGFKLHTENSSYNHNGSSTYYIAFAERPSFAKNFSSPNAR